MLYTNGQPSYSRRHPTCWASPQWSHTVSSTMCHGVRISAPLSPHLSTEWQCTATQIETPICTRRTTTPVHLITTELVRSGHITDGNAERLDHTSRLRIFIPDIGTHPPGMALQRTAWVWLNRLSRLHKREMAYSGACECGAQERTVDHASNVQSILT